MEKTITDDGLLSFASWQPSPNFNERPAGADDISLVVIHNISLPPNEFGTGRVQEFFCNQLDSRLHPYFVEINDLKVSSHLFIERTGKITQFVRFNDRAWHAGKSCYQHRDNCNDFSIGIELEGTDSLAYTQQQYRALDVTLKALFQRYPLLNATRITGHEHIAPGRKTDPGNAFDWQLVFAGLKEKK